MKNNFSQKKIKIYNSLTRQIENFEPIDPNNIKMYVCGPTVYSRAHVGNARPTVVFDALFRLLNLYYPNVTYVRNITDVDDKIMNAAKEKKISILELTTKTIGFFHEDMTALNNLPPTFEPKATDYIQQMIDIIQTLIYDGYAYKSDDHVVFDVSSFKQYGSLSKKGDLCFGARVDVADYKVNPCDFVLWKPSEEGEVGWDSPFGYGRPGWHIECSAMGINLLGETFDIHGGGIDLMFPHHENEIAQSCALTGKDKYANYWMHNGHVTANGEKMSKSLGNIITIENEIKKYPGEAIRLALLSAHYRQPLDWSDNLLIQMKRNLDKMYNVLLMQDKELKENKKDTNKQDTNNTGGEINKDVIDALENDLNFPLALSRLYKVSKEFPEDLKKTGNFLGILLEDPESWFKKSWIRKADSSEKNDDVPEDYINKMINERNEARENKDFKKADDIRKELLDDGIILEDSHGNTFWKKSW